MEKVEYSDIVFLEKMRDIKATIRNSGFRIDYERAYQVDQQMREVIDKLFDEDTDDTSLVDLYKKLDKKIDRRVSDTLVFYYFALYQDNVELLKKVLENGIELYDENDHGCIELLDREFTKHFSMDQYLFLLENCSEELREFYNHCFAHVPLSREMDSRKKLIKELNELSEALFSTENPLEEEERIGLEKKFSKISRELKTMTIPKYSEEEKEMFCHKFAEVLTKDPFICKTGKRGEFSEDYYKGLLIPEVFQVFEVDELLRLSEVQKGLVSDAITDDMLVRLKELFNKYPHYSCKMKLNSSLLRTFSDEELVSLPGEDVPLYEKASLEEIPGRFKRVLKANPNFRKYPEIIRKDIFEAIPEEDLAGLSDRAIHRIHKLVVHEKLYDKKAKYHIQRESRRIAKVDKVLQKVIKKFYR